jgi:DNA-binding MarR family transcriptional regulator
MESSPPARPALPTLLSHALVAYTIELDNEFEHRMPHRTSLGPSAAGGGPWLVSLAMWLNCLRYVDAAGVSVRELTRLARTGSNLEGMRRWGYLTIDNLGVRTSSRQPKPDAILRATSHGLRARQAWAPLPGEIEQRWAQRFGAAEVGRLREALAGIAGQLDAGLPDCMPILGYGLWSAAPAGNHSAGDHSAGDHSAGDHSAGDHSAGDHSAGDHSAGDHSAGGPPGEAGLCALLARVLLAFAIDFEQDSPVSLMISANLLRVLGAGQVRVRELPQRSGLSKEAIAMGLGILRTRGLATEQADPGGGRWKVAALTDAGRRAALAGRRRISEIEESWQARFGQAAVGELRQALERLAGEPGQPSLLLDGLLPYPDGWRAKVRQPDALPHFPAVLHRGGYPDGS